MNNMTVAEKARKIKQDSFKMAITDVGLRNAALKAIQHALREKKSDIFSANNEDLEKAVADNIAAPIYNRLKFDQHKLSDVISGIEGLIGLEDPIGKQLLKRRLDDSLILHKVSCPIGVIGVIFESRPDALVQISALCIKSGNCAILKGGSEAANTNKALFEVIHNAGVSAGLPEGFVTLIENRADIGDLLKCHDSIDLLIPRGSNQFVQYIMSNSKIPVMGHADGICHIYVDKYADVKKALPVILDSKTQYVAACNTVETLLVHKDVAKELLPALKELAESSPHPVQLRGCAGTRSIISCTNVTEKDYETEYLDYIVSIKIVSNIDEAINHINRYGSHHTDCIITEDASATAQFMDQVDSAGVYQNCSTRFADGFRYGFGAEVGISTGKLHARGPVGLDGLVTYKYKLYGDGQIVEDYATGRRGFKFKNF